MPDFNAMRDRLAEYPVAETLIGLCLLLLAAFVADFVVRRVLIRLLLKLIDRGGRTDMDDLLKPVVGTLARIAPAIVIHQGIAAVPHLAPVVVKLTQNVANAFAIVVVVMALAASMDVVNTLYSRSPRGHRRVIKGYLQVLKIVFYAIGAILVIATLIDRSPLLLLSGLGALAAVLMLVFKDTILSLVASVQLNSNDMLRVGDWIEMPQVNADGDVIDIALHTVTVQNWDMTVTTIPTKKLISDSFKNWRNMSERGARRIKRALHLDQGSVHFLDAEQLERLRRIRLLRDYLGEKEAELRDWNAALAEDAGDVANTRRFTNLGTFRVYVQRYLRAHAGLRQDMTLLVRQLQPGAEGIPLEVYCFSADTRWAAYENLQSDIFDHLLAILPEFGLRVFQSPSGAEIATALGATQGTPRAIASADSLS